MQEAASSPVDRGLLIREPWIGMILSGRKDWEMRGRATRMRGRIALIRSGSGLVVGTARLTGCGEPLTPAGMMANAHRHCIPAGGMAAASAAGWTVPWFLDEVFALPAPIPYRHPQGAVGWVKLEPEVVAALVA